MEKVLYEIRPWLFLGLGIYALKYGDSSLLATISGVTIIFCSALILFARLRNRGVL